MYSFARAAQAPQMEQNDRNAFLEARGLKSEVKVSAGPAPSEGLGSRTSGYVFYCLLFIKEFISLFLERGEGRERNIQQLTLTSPHTGDQAYNPGTCPDSELNLSVCRPELNLRSHTRQGDASFL